MTSVVRHHAQETVRLLCLLLLLNCSVPCPASGADESTRVRIALTREAGAAPLLIAIDAGFFASAHLNPQLSFFDTDASVSAAVAAGKAEIGMAALSATFYQFAAAHHLKIIGSRSSEQTGFPMHALLIGKEAHAAGFSGVRGLVNSRIGVADTASGEYYGLYSIASRFNLDFGSIKVTAFRSTAAESSALAHRDVQAVIVPFTTALQAARNGRTLLRLSDFAQWQQGVVFTSAQAIATNRTLVESFMRAYQRGAAEYALNFLSYDDGGDFIPGPRYDQYLSSIARQVHISSDALAKTKTYCDRRANLDVADIEKQVRFWQERGRIDKGIVAADLLDLSFIGEDPANAHASMRTTFSASSMP